MHTLHYKKRILFFCVLFIVCAVFPASAAQLSLSGTITGRVTDAETGDVLPSVTVTLSPPVRDGLRRGSKTATTNFTGDFSFITVPAGSWTLVLSSPGYKTTVITSIWVSTGFETYVPVQLHSTDLEAKPDTLYISNTQIAGKFATSTFYQLLSSTIRLKYAERPAELSTQLPGIDSENHIRGLRQSDGSITFDGISLRDPLFSGAPAELFIPLSSLQEINVTPGLFLPRSGNTSSAAVSVTTLSPVSEWTRILRTKNSLSLLNGKDQQFKLNPRDQLILEFTAGGPAHLFGRKINLLFSGKTNNQQNRTPGLDVQDPEENNITDYPHNRSSLYSAFGKTTFYPNNTSTVTIGTLFGSLYQQEDSWLWRYRNTSNIYPDLPSLVQNSFIGYINYTGSPSPGISVEARLSKYDFQFKHGLIKENLGWLWTPCDVIAAKTSYNLSPQFGTINPYGVQDIFIDSGILDSYWSGRSQIVSAAVSASYSLRELYQINTGAELNLYNTSNHFKKNSIETPLLLQNNFSAKPYTVSLYYSGTFHKQNVLFDSGLELLYFNPQSSPAAFKTPLSTEPSKVSKQFRASPFIGIAVEPKSSVVVFANLGFRYRLPSFNALFSPQQSGTATDKSILSGNPHLNLQKYTTAEFGIRFFLKNKTTASASAYVNKLSNLEAADTISAYLSQIPRYNSTGEANIYGIEFKADHKINDNIALSLSYNLITAKGNFIYYNPSRAIPEIPETINDFTTIAAPQSLRQFGTIQPSFPLTYEKRHSINASVECFVPDKTGPTMFGMYLFEKTTADFTIIAESGSPYSPLKSDGTLSSDINTARNPWLINTYAHIEKSLTSRITLFADIRNLFNRIKPTAYYPMTNSANNLGKTLRPQSLGEFTEPSSSYQYSSIADTNHNGTIEPDEYNAAYSRFLQDFTRTSPLYSLPREIWFGIKFNF